MSAYDNDRRVVQDTSYLRGSYEIDRFWRVMTDDDGRWHAYYLGEWGEAVGDPIGGFAAGTATADEKIRELIGDPRAAYARGEQR